MASTDASAYPIKNTAWRVTFPILDADGDLVTGATGLDSEVSKDGGTFADCTNEATEIATNSGMYYLDLTSTEMNADTVAIIVKSSGKTTPIVVYPITVSTAKLGVNVVNIAGSAVNTSSAQLGVNVVNAAGTAWGSGAITAGAIATGAITNAKFAAGAIDAAAIAADAIGASELAADAASEIGTAVWATATRVLTANTNLSIPTASDIRSAVGLASANLDTQLTAIDDYLDIEVAAIKAKTDNLPASPAATGDIPTAADIRAEIDSNSTQLAAIVADTNELQSDWTDGGRLDLILDARASQSSVDDLPTNSELATALAAADDAVLAAIAALNNLSAAEVNAEVVDALNTDTYAEPGQGAPAATASLATKIGYLYKAWRNKKEQTSSLWTLYNDDGTTAGQKSTISDDGTTATRGEVATGA